ncbi:hypothetical protein HYH02_006748 [Chlamydomonas schloesseri]|uniref:Uncharacterized protein n=1 Tax=Chlamydomonas schloesseri TaxID=2026947 RepID=A0A836B5P8_9CHLO|nr:hypothetical protein HYH02_006748 [Chlamydomonas schloesseri]|eukprot:KAG2448163.1 hypothetical protein HYH02_006748 [Chlamydomonas schloesseri]
MRGDTLTAKASHESKRTRLLSMLRGLKQVTDAVSINNGPSLPPSSPDATGPAPSSPEDTHTDTVKPWRGSGSDAMPGMGGNHLSYPPWAPLPPGSPGDVQRAPGPDAASGPYPASGPDAAPGPDPASGPDSAFGPDAASGPDSAFGTSNNDGWRSPPWNNWDHYVSPPARNYWDQYVSPPWWHWPGSGSPPPREPTLLERIAGALRTVSGDLGLWDFIEFVQDVAPLMPEIVSDIGNLAGYVDKLIQDPEAASLLNANGDSSVALHRTLRDTLLVLLSTDTGSTFADDLLNSQDVDLAAAATAVDLPSMLKALGNGVVVGDLAQGDDYQVADFALGFVEVAAGILEEAVRPDGRLNLFTVVKDVVVVAAQASETFSNNMWAAAQQADGVLYQTGTEYYALRRLTSNLQRVSYSLARLQSRLQ